MASFTENDDNEIISSINITPLVDIMLVLLIIFMLVSNISKMADLAAIDIELPKAATGEDKKTHAISITISKEGDFYLSGIKTASFDDLSQQLKKRYEEATDIQVIISADRKTYHEYVVDVIDAVRSLGIQKFSINVES